MQCEYFHPKTRQLAIKHTHGSQLLLARSGAGKTTTITTKIVYMVEKENIAEIIKYLNY